jgi:hypothetical protein
MICRGSSIMYAVAPSPTGSISMDLECSHKFAEVQILFCSPCSDNSNSDFVII